MTASRPRRSQVGGRWRGVVVAITLVALSAGVPTALAAASLGEYRDNFSLISYGNSLGSLTWGPDWIESNDDGSPWTGNVRIGSEPFCPSLLCLIIGKDPSVTDSAIQRSADLSAADSATLSFTYRRHDHAPGPGVVRLSVSATGSGGWSTLRDYPLEVTDPDPVVESHDITPWISSSTTIRFELVGNPDISHMNVDDLAIELFGADNVAPQLDPIANATIDEEVPFAFTATASDANLNDALSFELDGSQPAGALMSANGAFTWTPSEAQGPGVYSFGVTVRDDGTPSLSDTHTVTITVAEVNALPSLDAIGNRAVEEGSLLTFTATAEDAETPANDLVFNLSGNPPSGAAISSSGLFTWTPTESQGPGSYSFDVKVWDDGVPAQYDYETVVVTVAEKNLAPNLAPIANRTVAEGVTTTFTAAATDADVPTNTLSYHLAGAPPGAGITSGGVFSWTPTDVQGPGTYTFDVVVIDDGVPVRSDSDTVTITVTEANIAPTINPISPMSVDEGSLLQFTASATDPDSPANLVSFSLSGAPVGAAISPGGTFTWTPTEAQGPGTHRFDVVATDDGVPAMSSTAPVTVVVGEINLAPVLNPIAPPTINEGSLFTIQASATDIDSPANVLTFTLDGAPAGADITAAGLLTWTPSEAQGPGTHTFDVVVTDNGSPKLSDRQTVTVEVNDANNAPEITPIGTVTGPEGQLITFTATARDPDLPANTFWFRLSGAIPSGASITSGGVFAWIPAEEQGPGTYTFDVVVTDTGSPARSSSERVTVVVFEANQAPQIAVPTEYEVEAGLPFLLVVTGIDADLPAQALHYSATGLPAGAEFAASGELTWQPDEAAVGETHEVKITVADDGSPEMSSTTTFTFFVVTANVAPVLAPIGNRQIAAGELLTFVAQASDADGPADLLTFAISKDAPAGAAIDPSTGVFEWRPSAAQDRMSHTFAITVTDGGTLPKSDMETITVKVGRPNVAPTVAQPPDQRSMPGEAVTFVVSATDPDSYPGTVAFTAENLPPGLEIDGASGAISGEAGFDGLAGSPYTVRIVVSDGMDRTAVEFVWAIAGVEEPLGATPTRNAIVSGINQVTSAPAQPGEVRNNIGRSLVLMARAVRTGATEMSLPILFLLLVIGAITAFGRIGLVPILRRGTRYEGVLVRYDADAGSGLVMRAMDGAEVFVHGSTISRRDRGRIIEGDDVTFRTIDGAYRDLVTYLRRRR